MSAQVLGTPRLSTLAGDVDKINLAYLNVNLTAPIVSKTGRGVNLQSTWSYNNWIWTPAGGTWKTTTMSNYGETIADPLAGRVDAVQKRELPRTRMTPPMARAGPIRRQAIW
jgi:hypothetical protein